MRLTTRTNLAARVLMFCGVNADRLVRAQEIAEACNASTNHTAQVIHRLQQNDFVETQRGRGGGLRLARPAEEISIGHLFRTLESDVPLTECFSEEANGCPLSEVCVLKRALARSLEAFYGALDDLTLADLVEGNCGLETVLSVPALPASCNARPVPVAHA